jgi:arsenate reductase (thioredoxin)
MSRPTRVLFVCTHNSARSQMAEGYLNALGGDRFDARSAGTEARGIHPLAIQAMAEEGIDVAMQESKTIDRFLKQPFDLVITVCDDAAEACPVFPGAAKRMHWSFPDPSKTIGDDDERYAAFVRVRDAIRERIEQELLAS